MWWQSWRARVGNKLGNETWDNVNSLAAAELCGESLAPSAMTNTSWPDRLATISSQRDFFFQTYLFGCVAVCPYFHWEATMFWNWLRSKCKWGNYGSVKGSALRKLNKCSCWLHIHMLVSYRQGGALDQIWKLLGVTWEKCFFGPQGLLLLNALHNVTALALMHLLHISDDSICFLNMKMKLLGIE